jgi:hypothetical protein
MTCRFCGNNSVGISFTDWVKPTFTDHDKLLPGDSICDECLFWFDERSKDLAEIVGKEKPQRMRNYSHFIVGGEWTPLSKGNKPKMTDLLLRQPFPELAAIAQSGQKHIIFRAMRNPPGSASGWVQFEEQSLFVYPLELKTMLDTIESLYSEFSKGEIGTGQYKGYHVVKFGFQKWDKLEREIKQARGSLLFELALFLAQKGEPIDRATSKGSGLIDGDLERNTSRLQEPLPNDNLATVRESGQIGSIHKQPREICQLSMF